MPEHDRTAWFGGCRRWGQINLWEIDPVDADVAYWADVFRRMRLDGLTLTCAGFVTYYPTEIAGLRRSPWLGARDLFGEFVAAARGLGMRVLARTDVGGVPRDVYFSHPDWVTVDLDGKPFKY